MVLAASPMEPRKLSSFIGVRAKPTIAYREPSEPWLARSYIAGITLRLARSPDAPKRTTVQDSGPFAPPEWFASIVSCLPSAQSQVFPRICTISLYLNAIFLQINAELLGVF